MDTSKSKIPTPFGMAPFTATSNLMLPLPFPLEEAVKKTQQAAKALAEMAENYDAKVTEYKFKDDMTLLQAVPASVLEGLPDDKKKNPFHPIQLDFTDPKVIESLSNGTYQSPEFSIWMVSACIAVYANND